MTFAEYIAKPATKRAKKRKTLTQLHLETHMSYSILHGLANGRLLKNYPKAHLLSKATGGRVTIKELCEPPEGLCTPAQDRAS